MKEKIALLSILANIFLAGGKITTGFFSNSSAILAAGIDSLVDILSSFISYLGIKLAKKPADKEHPYGHYKFEVLGGVAITVIILAAGLGIIYEAVKNISNPQPVQVGYWAFGVMIASAFVNELMARLKTHYGKKENSVSLLSDGVHSRIDVYSSLIVLGGLFLSPFWVYADSVLAILMGIYVAKEAFLVGKEATGSLLDVSAGEEVEERIKKIALQEKIEIVSLKTQKKGSVFTANLEIKLPGDLKVEEAAKISDRLRSQLMNQIENLRYVVVQISSHQIQRAFYQPSLGRGFGWQRRGFFEGKTGRGENEKPSGDCVCPGCGHTTPHQRGVPCTTLKCSQCGLILERK